MKGVCSPPPQSEGWAYSQMRSFHWSCYRERFGETGGRGLSWRLLLLFEQPARINLWLGLSQRDKWHSPCVLTFRQSSCQNGTRKDCVQESSGHLNTAGWSSLCSGLYEDPWAEPPGTLAHPECLICKWHLPAEAVPLENNTGGSPTSFLTQTFLFFLTTSWTQRKEIHKRKGEALNFIKGSQNSDPEFSKAGKFRWRLRMSHKCTYCSSHAI